LHGQLSAPLDNGSALTAPHRAPAGTRAAKEFSRQAYDTGVVIATCPGCRARHLLADRKGWFGAQGSVEDFLAERGEGVRPRMCSVLVGLALFGWALQRCAAAEVGRAQACQAALLLTAAPCPPRPGVVRKRDDGTEEILLEDLLGWSKAPSA
jgi:hypothetical protein